MTFADASAEDTTATFSATGTYVLRLTANDSEEEAYDELTVRVFNTNAPRGFLEAYWKLGDYLWSKYDERW